MRQFFRCLPLPGRVLKCIVAQERRGSTWQALSILAAMQLRGGFSANKVQKQQQQQQLGPYNDLETAI